MKTLAIFLLALQITYAQTARHRTVILMGSRFDITIVDKDSTAAEEKINIAIAEISRIENLISEWRASTEISEVNKNAGIRPVKVSPEVIKLTERALWFSKITDGAFDISIAAMDKIWRFDDSMDTPPTPQQVKASIRNVGYKNIIINRKKSTIFLKNKGMKIGFGATGKSYSADKTKALMQQLGVQAGIINASGDIALWGTQPDGSAWTVGIADPFQSGEVLKVLKLRNTAIVTSGDYQKFVEFGGKRYSHIINPKTGYPSTGLTSVTITGENAETANGLSTSVMVLGKEKGLRLLKKFPSYQYLIIEDNGNITQSTEFDQ